MDLNQLAQLIEQQRGEIQLLRQLVEQGQAQTAAASGAAQDAAQPFPSGASLACGSPLVETKVPRKERLTSLQNQVLYPIISCIEREPASLQRTSCRLPSGGSPRRAHARRPRSRAGKRGAADAEA